jgi:hypothetical protein
VPADFIGELGRTGLITLETVANSKDQQVRFYKGYYPVPDFGDFTGTPLYKAQFDEKTSVMSYYYKKSDLGAGEQILIYSFTSALSDYGFAWQSSYVNDAGYTVDVYYNEEKDMSVHFGQDQLDGVVCWFFAIH